MGICELLVNNFSPSWYSKLPTFPVIKHNQSIFFNLIIASVFYVFPISKINYNNIVPVDIIYMYITYI